MRRARRSSARLAVALLALSSTGLSVSGLSAKRLSAQAPSADTSAVVVRAATIIDGMGQVLTNHDVVVRGGRIVAVRPQSGRADIDLGNRVLSPGLIDTHVHLGWYITAKGAPAPAR